MPMKVEAAIVTQKRPDASYNTDSVNVNGKVMPREVIKNGYKGSGIISGSVYFALTSSDVEGFADATVTAFNERAELFSRARDPISVFSGFFEDCRGALINMNRSPDELVSAGFYASGRKVVLAHNGATKLYMQRLGICTPVTSAKVKDTIADFSSSTFNDVCAGDIFILLSPGVAEVLSEKDIEDILKISDGSVKRIVNYILKAALANEGSKAVSAIVVKVLETALEEEIKIPAFVPDFSGIKDNGAEENAADEEPAQESVSPEENVNEADMSENSSEETVAEESSSENDSEEQLIRENGKSELNDIAQVFSKNALEMFEEANTDSRVAETDGNKEEFVEGAEMTEAISVSSEADGENGETTEESVEETENKSRTFLFVILGIMLAVSVCVIFAVAVFPAFSDGNSEETTVEETTGEETSAEESSSEETTDEETTDEETTEETAEETVQAETTTKRRSESEQTTAAAVVVPETTAASATETPTESETEESTEAETEEEPATEEETSAEETSAEETSSDETASSEETISEDTSDESSAEETEASAESMSEESSSSESASDNNETQAIV